MTNDEFLMPSLRTLLILGRVSNLPTIWSNCLAGWWLGGAGNVQKLPFLFAGTTFLYVGGMFLNDAFDVEFDRQHRMERPIPSGAVSLETVWRWGLLWLALGAGCLIWLGGLTGTLAVALTGCIVLYDALHKHTALAPLLMGLCRWLVYLIAASTGINRVTGWSIWCGLALAAYIGGVSYLARRESLLGPLRYWPCLLLAVPIVLALIMNTNQYLEAALLISAVLGLWILRALRQTLWSPQPNIGRTVSWLLGGIVLVDWLAVADAPRQLAFVFIALFLTALLLQRSVPAT